MILTLIFRKITGRTKVQFAMLAAVTLKMMGGFRVRIVTLILTTHEILREKLVATERGDWHGD